MYRIWTLEEARQVLPELIRSTKEAHDEYNRILSHIRVTILPENEQEAEEERLQLILQSWVRSVLQIGAEVKGPWLVDFDYGRGYYCWHLGEEDILFSHDYSSGFQGRRPLNEDREAEYPQEGSRDTEEYP